MPVPPHFPLSPNFAAARFHKQPFPNNPSGDLVLHLSGNSRYRLFTMAPSDISLGSSAGDAAPISDDNRPTQGIFTNEQKEFLNTFLEDYLALSSSVTGGTKSTKEVKR